MYEGLYCDMDVKEERKFVKDNSKNIEDIRKRLDTARISKTREYRTQVEAEAALIDGRLVAANLPFIALIDEHKEKRSKIMAAEKAAIEAEELIIEVNRCEEEAFMMDKIMIIEAQEKKAEQESRDQKIAAAAKAKATADAQAAKDQAILDKLDAEETAKQADISRLASEKAAAAAKIQAEADKKQAKIDADRMAAHAAEAAKQAEVKRQSDEKAAKETERLRIESNKKHVGSVRREIKERFMKVAGIDEKAAKKIVLEIISMDERFTINY